MIEVIKYGSPTVKREINALPLQPREAAEAFQAAGVEPVKVLLGDNDETQYLSFLYSPAHKDENLDERILAELKKRASLTKLGVSCTSYFQHPPAHKRKPGDEYVTLSTWMFNQTGEMQRLVAFEFP